MFDCTAHVKPLGSYDVFVLQAYGYKNWTVCHPIGTFDDFPDASQAQRAQLYQIAIAKNSKPSIFQLLSLSLA